MVINITLHIKGRKRKRGKFPVGKTYTIIETTDDTSPLINLTQSESWFVSTRFSSKAESIKCLLNINKLHFNSNLSFSPMGKSQNLRYFLENEISKSYNKNLHHIQVCKGY